MTSVCVHLENVAGIEAALGWAGNHTLVADRPAGTAGGLGLGFNGAELPALALGGCFCNDLRYVAHRKGAEIASLAVEVRLHLDGKPLLAEAAEMDVRCTLRDGSDPARIVEEARSSCMVSNSLRRGLAVSIRTGD